MKDKTREDERDKRREQKIKRSREDEAELSSSLSSVGELILTIQRLNCRFQKLIN